MKIPSFFEWPGKDIVLTLLFGVISLVGMIYSIMSLDSVNHWYCKDAVSYSTLLECQTGCHEDSDHRCGTWSDALGSSALITSLCIFIFGILVVFVLIMGWSSITRLLCLVSDDGNATGEVVGLIGALFPFSVIIVRLAFFDGFYGKENKHIVTSVLLALWLIVGFGFCLVINDKLSGKKKKKKRRHKHDDTETGEVVYRDPEDVYY